MNARTKISTLALIAAVAATGAALAQEKRLAFKDGPGLQAFQANCGTCHSLDYVILNSPFLDRGGWEAEVKKMANAFGAPISAPDQATITEYLAENYGKR